VLPREAATGREETHVPGSGDSYLLTGLLELAPQGANGPGPISAGSSQPPFPAQLGTVSRYWSKRYWLGLHLRAWFGESHLAISFLSLAQVQSLLLLRVLCSARAGLWLGHGRSPCGTISCSNIQCFAVSVWALGMVWGLSPAASSHHLSVRLCRAWWAPQGALRHGYGERGWWKSQGGIILVLKLVNNLVCALQDRCKKVLNTRCGARLVPGCQPQVPPPSQTSPSVPPWLKHVL